MRPCVPHPKVRRALKKPEAERSEEEAAVLLLHRETVEELSKRQVRTDGLKRKQEEVSVTAMYKSGVFLTREADSQCVLRNNHLEPFPSIFRFNFSCLPLMYVEKYSQIIREGFAVDTFWF